MGSTYNAYAVDCYNHAKAAGISNIDFYITPTTKQNAKTQINNTLSKLFAAGVMTGKLWIDVEDSS